MQRTTAHTPVKPPKSLLIGCWILVAILLVTGYLGLNSTERALNLPEDQSTWTAWQSFTSGLGKAGGALCIAGLVLIVFIIVGIPLLTDVKEAKKSALRFYRAFPLTMFMLPGALCLLVFNYLPMPGIVLAFKTFKKGRGSVVGSILNSMWNGVRGFSFLGTPTAQGYIRNTLLYNFVWMFIGLFVAVAIAIGLSHMRNKRATKFYQTFIFMPYFLSWVIASYLLYAMISFDKGLVGNALNSMGILDKSNYVNFYQAPKYWPFILTMMNQWKYMGYNSIIYTSAIAGIDREMYEAAVLDGANGWQKIRYITLPMLKPMMIIMTIMAMGRMANGDFGLFYNLPMDSGPLKAITGVYDTYTFGMIVGSGTTNYGTIAAASLFQSMLGFILIFSSNMVVRKISPENSLF